MSDSKSTPNNHNLSDLQEVCTEDILFSDLNDNHVDITSVIKDVALVQTPEFNDQDRGAFIVIDDEALTTEQLLKDCFGANYSSFSESKDGIYLIKGGDGLSKELKTSFACSLVRMRSKELKFSDTLRLIGYGIDRYKKSWKNFYEKCRRWVNLIVEKLKNGVPVQSIKIGGKGRNMVITPHKIKKAKFISQQQQRSNKQLLRSDAIVYEMLREVNRQNGKVEDYNLNKISKSQLKRYKKALGLTDRLYNSSTVARDAAVNDPLNRIVMVLTLLWDQQRRSKYNQFNVINWDGCTFFKKTMVKAHLGAAIIGTTARLKHNNSGKKRKSVDKWSDHLELTGFKILIGSMPTGASIPPVYIFSDKNLEKGFYVDLDGTACAVPCPLFMVNGTTKKCRVYFTRSGSIDNAIFSEIINDFYIPMVNYLRHSDVSHLCQDFTFFFDGDSSQLCSLEKQSMSYMLAQEKIGAIKLNANTSEIDQPNDLNTNGFNAMKKQLADPQKEPTEGDYNSIKQKIETAYNVNVGETSKAQETLINKSSFTLAKLNQIIPDIFSANPVRKSWKGIVPFDEKEILMRCPKFEMEMYMKQWLEFRSSQNFNKAISILENDGEISDLAFLEYKELKFLKPTLFDQSQLQLASRRLTQLISPQRTTNELRRGFYLSNTKNLKDEQELKAKALDFIVAQSKRLLELSNTHQHSLKSKLQLPQYSQGARCSGCNMVYELMKDTVDYLSEKVDFFAPFYDIKYDKCNNCNAFFCFSCVLHKKTQHNFFACHGYNPNNFENEKKSKKRKKSNKQSNNASSSSNSTIGVTDVISVNDDDDDDIDLGIYGYKHKEEDYKLLLNEYEMQGRHKTDYDWELSNDDADSANNVMSFILTKKSYYMKLFGIDEPDGIYQLDNSQLNFIAPLLLAKLQQLFSMHMIRVRDHNCNFENSFVWGWLRMNLPVIAALLLLSRHLNLNFRDIKSKNSIEAIYVEFDHCKLIPIPKQRFKAFNKHNTLAGNYLVYRKINRKDTLLRSGKAINIGKRISEHNAKYKKKSEQKQSKFYANNKDHWNELKFYYGISWQRKNDAAVLSLFEFNRITLTKLNNQKWGGGEAGLINRMVNMVAYAIECVYSWFVDRSDLQNLSTEAPGFESPLGYHLRKKELLKKLNMAQDLITHENTTTTSTTATSSSSQDLQNDESEANIQQRIDFSNIS